jgi:hypothetical protein
MLHCSIGIGEYMDKRAIEAAKGRAALLGPTLNRFSIAKLTLSGFVVDADPFELWFDPERLRTIHFKNNCVDAGFFLPDDIQDHVTITFPREIEERALHMWIYRVDPRKEVKLIELRKGAKIAEWSAQSEKKIQKLLIDGAPNGRDVNLGKPSQNLTMRVGNKDANGENTEKQRKKRKKNKGK